MWFGTYVDIPDGWVECDGENGTPDLRRRFIYGANPLHAPLSSGGQTHHQHDRDTQPGTHGHSGVASSANIALDSGSDIYSHETDNTLSDDGTGHEHVLSIDDNEHVHNFRSWWTSHTPRYTALIFIMKL